MPSVGELRPDLLKLLTWFCTKCGIEGLYQSKPHRSDTQIQAKLLQFGYSSYMDTYVWAVCGSKNRHQKDMWFKEIGLRAQNLLTVLGSIVNVIVGGGRGKGNLYYHSTSTRIFTLMMNKKSSSKYYEENVYRHNSDAHHR